MQLDNWSCEGRLSGEKPVCYKYEHVLRRSATE